MRKAEITTTQIMNAALGIAAEKGAGKVTLDAVAKASGLSKGGLLYHFPSKDALITAMVQHLIDDADNIRQQILQHETSPLVAQLKTREVFTKSIAENTAMAILAAAAEQPALLAPIKRHNAAMLADVVTEHGDNPAAMLLFAASEGLIFHQLLNISPFNAEQKAKLEEYLVIRAQELTQ